MSEVANKRTDDGLTRLKTHLTSPLGTFTHFADKPLRILRLCPPSLKNTDGAYKMQVYGLYDL